MPNVLILCTGNSARSILGEVMFTELSGGEWTGYSAGSHPKGEPSLGAIRQLEAMGYPTEGLNSKSWDVFAGPDAPEMDLVVTVCDSAAGESCPIWPGAPARSHWGIPDPANHDPDTEAGRQAFALAAERLRARILLFLERYHPYMSPSQVASLADAVHHEMKD